MKLGGHSQKAEQKVTAAMIKVLGARGFMVLVALASLIIVAGANQKLK